MNIKELPSHLKELVLGLFRKSSALKPNVKRVAFMLILFAILGLLVLMYNESYCVGCETGHCQCTTQSILGFGIWVDLLLAAAAAYLIITIIALLWKA